MSTTVNQVYIDEFNANLRQLAQQKYARLKDTVQNVSSNAESYSFDRLGPMEAVKKEQKIQPTQEAQLSGPLFDTQFSRRTAIAKTFNVSEYIELEDQIQAKVAINSGVMQSMGMAMARAHDDEIIRAMGDDALDGDGNAVPFPDGTGPTGLNQIVGDGSSPISFDTITEVQERFLENDIQGEVAKTIVVGPKQIRKLLQLTEQTSADFVQREALQRLSQNLIVPNWMGMRWICSTRLLSPGADQIDCYAYTDRALGMAINSNMRTFIQQDPAHSYAYAMYAASTYGCVRVEDEHIVKISLADTL